MKKLFLYIFLTTLLASSCANNDIKNDEEISKDDQVVEEVAEENEIDDEDDTSNDIYIERTSDENNYVENDENRPPKVKSVSVDSISNNLKDGLKATVVAEDPEGDPVNFIYEWKLNGIVIPGANEEILLWNEEFKRGDTISIEVIPYDDQAQGVWKSQGSFEIPNSPPIIKSNPSGTIKNGNFSFKIEAMDLDDDEISYSINNAPSGMTVDSKTGEINWKFNSENEGDYKVDIIASDNQGGETHQELALTVKANTENK